MLASRLSPLASRLPLTLVVIVGLAAPGRAHALSINWAVCTPTDNVLRWNCNVQTDVPSDLRIRSCEGSGCTFSTYSGWSLNKTNHHLVLFGLKGATDYDWQAVVRPAGGGANVYGAVTDLDTDPLPEEVADIVFTPSGGTPTTKNVLFNYSCLADGATGHLEDPDWLVIADNQGNVIWYEDPKGITNDPDLPGVPVTVTGLSVTRPDRHILAIYDNSWLVEYLPSGAAVRVLCHDDGAGMCPDGATEPDGLFDGFISHDATRAGTHIFAISSVNLEVEDTEPCESGDTHAIVLDGLYGFDTTSNALDVTWDMRSAFPDFGEASCPGNPCAGNTYWTEFSYWTDYELTGCDWSHLNAVWVDAADNWLLSLKSRDEVIQVVGDDSSSDYGELGWELVGTGGGDWEMQGGETFIGQHHAWWTMDGTIRIFDNGDVTGHPSRGIELELAGAPGVDGTATVVQSLVNSGGFYCETGGSSYDFLVTDDVLVTCASASTTTFNGVQFDEFASDGSLVWSMTAECSGGRTDRALPSYRGIANVL